MPLLRGRRAVLAGDHRQLPPVVKSAEAAAKGLGITLFERLLEQHPGLGVMLTEQYRMHAAICRWEAGVRVGVNNRGHVREQEQYISQVNCGDAHDLDRVH